MHGSHDQQQREEALQQELETRKSILSQILEQDARARLANISMVKPEKARQIENGLISMARSGQLNTKVNEELLIKIIEQFNSETKIDKKPITINRRRYKIDDDDDN